MRWLECEVLKKTTDGYDRLGNEISTIKAVKTIKGRLTQFTSEDMTVFGRDVLVNNRKFITPYKGKLELVRIDGVTYEVTHLEDLGRFTFALIKGMM